MIVYKNRKVTAFFVNYDAKKDALKLQEALEAVGRYRMPAKSAKKISRISLSHLAQQPGLAVSPVPLGSSQGNPQRFRCFLHREAGKEP